MYTASGKLKMRLVETSCIWQLKTTKKKMFLEINYRETATTQQV
jgi:hypothetical protein